MEGGLEEGVSLLTSSIPWVFQYASEALERCIHLTGGWGLNGLLKSLQVSQQSCLNLNSDLRVAACRVSCPSMCPH